MQIIWSSEIFEFKLQKGKRPLSVLIYLIELNERKIHSFKVLFLELLFVLFLKHPSLQIIIPKLSF